MFSLFGWAGQHGYDYLDKRNSQGLREQARLKATGDNEPQDNLLSRFAKSKWSPMSVLTDEQYEEMLQEKLLKVEAEIAIIDERIEGFRKQAVFLEAQRKLQEKQDQIQEKI
jgi:hypothetical protein